MNGKPLPLDSPEMQAFVAYIKFLSIGATRGEFVTGLGDGKMPELKRAADPVRGKAVYARTCAPCHQPDGRGVLRDRNLPNFGYLNPPLWGPDTFNDGAGMATLIDARQFRSFQHAERHELHATRA